VLLGRWRNGNLHYSQEAIKSIIMKKNWIINNWVYFFVIAIFIWIFFVNILPRGYVVSGTDHAYFLNIEENFKSFFYTWSNSLGYGEGKPNNLQAAIPYYFIFYILGFAKLPANIIQSFLMPAFTFLSFLSFYISLNILFDKKNKRNEKILFSLLYGLNSYTLYLFMHVFGYFYQQIFYIFIPILISIVYKIFNTRNTKKYFFLFFFASLIGSMGYNNPGFFVAVNIIIFIIYIFENLLNPKEKYLERKLNLINYLVVLFILFVTNAYWIVPYLTTIVANATNLTSGGLIWKLGSWIKWQSILILNVFRIGGKFSDSLSYYNLLGKLILVTSFLYMMLIFGGALVKKTKNKIISMFSVLLVLLILVISKYYGPLGEVSIQIFSFPILNALRSSDKFLIFLPFVVFILIYAFIFDNKKINNKIKYAIIFILLIYPFPFFVGKLQQNISVMFKNGNSYLTAEYSFLVKVPQDYYDVSAYLNSLNNNNFKVQYLPFGVINSPGWSQYPKWKFVGNDLTTTLFNNPVQLPAHYLNSQQFNYGLLFNSYSDPNWVTRLLGLMNSKYLVFNRDVDDKFLEVTQDKINQLVKNGSLSTIFSGQYIDLYEVSDKYFLPQFYVPKEIIYSEKSKYDNFPALLNISKFNQDSLYLLGINKNVDNFINKIDESFFWGVDRDINNINFNRVEQFDFNQTGDVNNYFNGDIYVSGIPITYDMNINGKNILLNKVNNESDYVAINSINNYAQLFNINYNLSIDYNGVLVNNKYFELPSKSHNLIKFDANNPNLEILSDFKSISGNLLEDSSFEKKLGNGANSCGRGNPDLLLGISVSEGVGITPNTRALKIFSKNGNACTMLSLNPDNFDTDAYYKFSIHFKNVSGGVSKFGIWQEGSRLSEPYFSINTLNKDGWKFIEYIFKPQKETTSMTVFLYSDSDGSQEIINLYDDIILKKVSPNYEFSKVIYDFQNLQLLDELGENDGEIKITIPEKSKENIIIDPQFKLSLGNGANSCGTGDVKKPMDINIKKITSQGDDFNSLALTSKNGKACTILVTDKFKADLLYNFSIDYKNVIGNKTAFAIWQYGSNNSYPDVKNIIDNNIWENYKTIFKPNNGTTDLSVFLYSDSDGTQEVSNLYKNISLSPAGLIPDNIFSMKKYKTSYQAPKNVTFSKINPTRYKVFVTEAKSSFPLIFSESFHKNWQAKIQGSRIDDDDHFMANGYSNGWLINTVDVCENNNKCKINTDGSYDIEITIKYWPQQLFYLGILISGASLVGCIGYLIYDRRKRRKKRLPRRSVPCNDKKINIWRKK